MKEKITVEIFYSHNGVNYGFYDGQFFWSGKDDKFIEAMKDEMEFSKHKQTDIELIERWQTDLSIDASKISGNIVLMREAHQIGRAPKLVT